MNKIQKWFNNKVIGITMALSNTEKMFLSQKTSAFSDNSEKKIQDVNTGTLMNDLKNGEVTSEVQSLRWRLYKVLQASEGLRSTVTGVDEHGNKIISTEKINNKNGLRKVKIDQHDTFDLELVVDNSEITISVNDSLDKDTLNSTEYFALNKGIKPLNIIRGHIPTFEIETYTKKLNVRSINENTKLLEFYVSQYPDEFNRTSRLFISELKKIINDGKRSDMLDINGCSFITNKSLGSNDFMEYEYKITGFDKIIIFNGHYVIKFFAEVIVGGVDILEKYKIDSLDQKYLNKESKNLKTI
jgi:hypothetical protein